MNVLTPPHSLRLTWPLEPKCAFWLCGLACYGPRFPCLAVQH